MAKKAFNILEYISKDEILKKLNEIGSKNLTETGHGFSNLEKTTIIQSAKKSTTDYSKKAKEKPAISLIDVILAANRNYNKVVEPNINRIQQEYPDLKTFSQLNELIKTKTKEEFYDFWGHKDEKKYKTLTYILEKIGILKNKNQLSSNDFDLMNKWGNEADLLNYEKDIIGSVPNVAIATFQHLRMVFGIDTIKPDQRVKEVLDYEFGLENLSNLNTIVAVEQIAEIAEQRVITIDQIFVKYGSSYYNQHSNKLTIKKIVINLKKLGVDLDIISKATYLTIKQIERIK